MAAKTRTKSDPTFITAVARIEPALSTWRQRRKHREPIPEPLWQAIIGLAGRYGVSPVAQVLKVNYTALKQRLVGTAPPAVARSGPVAAQFVEVPMSSCPNGSPWVIELEDRGGSKLTLRVGPNDRASAVALAQELWRHRS